MSLYKTKNFFHSLKFALAGLHLALKTQRNLRIHFVIALIVLILGLFLKLSAIEWAIIVFCIILIFFAEMTNTAIESLIDLYCGDNCSQIAKDTKDIAAGAVLCSAVGVGVIGMLIFVPKIILLLGF